MKNTHRWALCAGILLASCAKIDRPASPESGPIPVEFKIVCPEMEQATRADEQAVTDLNLHLYHKTIAGMDKHLYYTGRTDRIAVTMLPGEYELYAVANAGRDLGEITKEDIANFRTNASTPADLERDGVLLMTARQTVDVNGPTQVPVKLTRTVAKINLSVTCSYSGVELYSLQLVNAPNSIAPFTRNQPANVSQCMTYPKNQINNAFSRSYYMYENAQGKNAGISSPLYRNKDTAPRYGSYIHIQGIAGSKKVDYFVFLGENITDDFNIYRNKVYTVQINIKGINTVDTRVSTTDISIGGFAAKYAPTVAATTTLDVSCLNDRDNQTYLSYALLEGAGQLSIDGIQRPANTPFQITAGPESKSVKLRYTQNTEGKVRIKFTLRDSYGYTVDKEVSTVYEKNNITITAGFEIAGEKRTLTSGDYTGTLISPVTLRISATASAPVNTSVAVSISVYYSLTEYKTNGMKETTSENTTGTITLKKGETYGELYLKSWSGYCIGYNSAGESKILAYGYGIFGGQLLRATAKYTDATTDYTVKK